MPSMPVRISKTSPHMNTKATHGKHRIAIDFYEKHREVLQKLFGPEMRFTFVVEHDCVKLLPGNKRQLYKRGNFISTETLSKDYKDIYPDWGKMEVDAEVTDSMIKIPFPEVKLRTKPIQYNRASRKKEKTTTTQRELVQLHPVEKLPQIPHDILDILYFIQDWMKVPAMSYSLLVLEGYIAISRGKINAVLEKYSKTPQNSS